jgi:MFS family permease
MAVSILFISLGSGLAGIVDKYLGRRGTIQVASVLVLTGAGGMVGTSGSFTAYIACKCLQGLGLGHYVGSAPPYGVECMVHASAGC